MFKKLLLIFVLGLIAVTSAITLSACGGGGDGGEIKGTGVSPNDSSPNKPTGANLTCDQVQKNYTVAHEKDWSNAVTAINTTHMKTVEPCDYEINIGNSHLSLPANNPYRDDAYFGSANPVFASGVKVSLKGEGSIQLNERGYLFFLIYNVDLTLDGPTIKSVVLESDKTEDDEGYTTIVIDGNSSFTLAKGSIIDSDCDCDAYYKIAPVKVVNGSLTMNGGTIRGENFDCRTNLRTSHRTSLVYVKNASVFTMNGGAISGNAISDGVYLTGDAAFTMNEGEISGSVSGSGVYIEGRYDKSPTFTMNGGVIKGNNASYNGGGVYVGRYATFTMNGGVIKGNSADGSGGGVYVNYGRFTKKAGAVIYGNENDIPDENKNIAAGLNGRYGHAMYFLGDIYIGKTVYKNLFRNTTLDEEVHFFLDSRDEGYPQNREPAELTIEDFEYESSEPCVWHWSYTPLCERDS